MVVVTKLVVRVVDNLLDVIVVDVVAKAVWLTTPLSAPLQQTRRCRMMLLLPGFLLLDRCLRTITMASSPSLMTI
jgi:hypothetical protein